MKWIIIALAALTLSGCGLTPGGDMLRAGIAQRGAVVADKALETAKFAMCKAATIGAVRREYGGSVAKADAYRAICNEAGPGRVIDPR